MPFWLFIGGSLNRLLVSLLLALNWGYTIGWFVSAYRTEGRTRKEGRGWRGG